LTLQLWFFALSVDDLEHLPLLCRSFPVKHRQVTAAPTLKNPLRLESIDKTRARQRMKLQVTSENVLKSWEGLPFKRDRVLLSVYPTSRNVGQNTAAIEPLEKLLLAQIPI